MHVPYVSPFRLWYQWKCHFLQKEQKLIFAFKKITTRAQWGRNTYKSLSNFFCVGEIYSEMLQVSCELHYFVANLLNDEEQLVQHL